MFVDHAVKEIETLMADEERWKALSQDERQEQETTFNQNSAQLPNPICTRVTNVLLGVWARCQSTSCLSDSAVGGCMYATAHSACCANATRITGNTA